MNQIDEVQLTEEQLKRIHDINMDLQEKYGIEKNISFAKKKMQELMKLLKADSWR